MPDTVRELVERCQPGKHFLGLWVVRQKAHRKRVVLWTVTYWDRQNEYSETRCYRNPMNAVRACARDLKVLRTASASGRPT